MWHVSSRSGVATLRTAMHLLLTYLLITAAKQKSYQTAHCNIKSAVLTLLISSSVVVTQECNGLNRMILSNTRLHKIAAVRKIGNQAINQIVLTFLE